jgi:hypothetical protein
MLLYGILFVEKRITIYNKAIMTKTDLPINETLSVLGLKPGAKRVLLDLSENGVSPAASIAARLRMPKPSVYDALHELVHESLVTEFSEDRGKTFAITDKEQILRIYKKKMEEMALAQSNLITFLGQQDKKTVVARPRIKFYSGVEGIKQAFRDMPWVKEHKEAYLMWPTTDMINLLGTDFLYEHRKPGLALGVTVNVVEPERDRVLQKGNEDWLKNDPKNLNKVRYAPKNIDWQMSYWLYGDKCLFASGGEEKIAFMIHSKEFTDLQKILWQQVWNISK